MQVVAIRGSTVKFGSGLSMPSLPSTLLGLPFTAEKTLKLKHLCQTPCSDPCGLHSFLVSLPLPFATVIPPVSFISASDKEGKKYCQGTASETEPSFMRERLLGRLPVCLAILITEFTLAFSHHLPKDLEWGRATCPFPDLGMG